MPSLEEMLNKKGEEIEEAPLIPVGTYLVLLKGSPIFGQSSQKKTDYVDFPGQFLRAEPDVDPTALAEFGGIEGKELKAGRSGLRFYLTEGTLPQVKRFFVEHLGLEEAKTLKEWIAEAPGHQVLVSFKHEPSQDGSRMYSSVARTMRP